MRVVGIMIDLKTKIKLFFFSLSVQGCPLVVVIRARSSNL